MGNGYVSNKTQPTFNSLQFYNTKAYVYLMPNLTATTVFLKENSHIFITINDDVTTDWKQQEIELMTNENLNELIHENNQSQKTLEFINSVQCQTHDFIGTIESNRVYLLTLNKPLNIRNFREKKQQVFKINNLSFSDEQPTAEIQKYVIKSVRPIEFQLENIKLWEDAQRNSEIILKREITSNFIKTFELSTSKYSTLYAIEVFGKNQAQIESNPTITIALDENILFIPTFNKIFSTTETVTKYFPWFDSDNVIEYEDALKWIEPIKLSDVLRPQDAKLIADMILFKYATDAEMNFVEFVTSGNDAGKIKGNQYVGYSGIQAALLVSKNVGGVTSRRFKNHYYSTPTLDYQDTNLRRVKQIINALGNNIKSDQNIGGGGNALHQILLPWYLKIQESLVPKKELIPNPNTSDTTNANVTSWVLPLDTKIFLTSHWFDIDVTEKIIRTISGPISLPAFKIAQIDSKLILPAPNDFHEEENFSTKPQEQLLDNEGTLKYFGHIIIKKTKLEDFFKINKGVTKTIKANDLVTSSVPSPFLTPELGFLCYLRDITPAGIFNWLKLTNHLNLGQVRFESGIVGSRTIEKTYVMNVRMRWSLSKFAKVSTTESWDFEVKFNGDVIFSDIGHRDVSDPYNKTLNLERDFKQKIADSISLCVEDFESLSRKMVIFDIDGDQMEDISDDAYSRYKEKESVIQVVVKMKEYRLESGFKYRSLIDQTVTTRNDLGITFLTKTQAHNLFEPFLPQELISDALQQVKIELIDETEVREIVVRRDWGHKTQINLNGYESITTDWSVFDPTSTVDRYLFY